MPHFVFEVYGIQSLFFTVAIRPVSREPPGIDEISETRASAPNREKKVPARVDGRYRQLGE